MQLKTRILVLIRVFPIFRKCKGVECEDRYGRAEPDAGDPAGRGPGQPLWHVRALPHNRQAVAAAAGHVLWRPTSQGEWIERKTTQWLLHLPLIKLITKCCPLIIVGSCGAELKSSDVTTKHCRRPWSPGRRASWAHPSLRAGPANQSQGNVTIFPRRPAATSAVSLQTRPELCGTVAASNYT